MFGLLFFTFFLGTVFGDKQECSSVADKFSALNIGHASLVPGNKIHGMYLTISPVFPNLNNLFIYRYV